MIVYAIFVLALTDLKFVLQPASAIQLHQAEFNDVRGKLKRSISTRHPSGKECQLPSPLKNGRYSPSPRRCPAKDTSPACRCVPGTAVREFWPIFYECDPGYILSSADNQTAGRRPSICNNGQWTPQLPVCMESHYDSEYNLAQFQSSSSYCGKPAEVLRSKRKIHGSVSNKGAWPWMAIFGMRKNNSLSGEIHWFCAGTLITTRHILTAAHCIADYRSRNLFFARFNDINLDNDSDNNGIIDVDIQRNNIIIHPGFKKEQVFSHNIAIIRLNTDLPITDYVRPVCLPSPDFTGKSFDDEIVHFTSWGQTDNDREWNRKRRYEAILHELQGTVVNHAECNYNYRNYQSDDFIIVDWDLICASIPNNKSCQGDAGSPVMLKIKDRYVLIGVVATPFRCYDEMYPRLFTRLAIYMEWIIANIKL